MTILSFIRRPLSGYADEKALQNFAPTAKDHGLELRGDPVARLAELIEIDNPADRARFEEMARLLGQADDKTV